MKVVVLGLDAVSSALVGELARREAIPSLAHLIRCIIRTGLRKVGISGRES